jgi:tRNA threonylcarbamoyladenosine biosynthesis protein TsaE
MGSMVSLKPAETESIGERWGRSAKKGWIIALSGELGAGKTQLVKGFARGLGIKSRVHSPTFAIVNEYLDGRLPLFHLDLYRLETNAQIKTAGLEEFLQPNGVTLIEWAERWEEIESTISQSSTSNPTPCFRVRIEITGETERRITYDDFGA